MTRKTSRIRPDHAAGRYIVIHSDNDERWTVEFGEVVRDRIVYGIDVAKSNVVTFAKSPSAAIEKFHAPAGRVFRVLDIESGDVHEFIVDHVAKGAACSAA